MSYAKDREEFMAVAGRNGLTVERCRALITHAQALELSNERECNEDMDEDTRFRLDLSDKAHQAAIVKALEGTGIKPIWNTDPRGFAVKLLLPDGTYNSWGGREHGYGVPTRSGA